MWELRPHPSPRLGPPRSEQPGLVPWPGTNLPAPLFVWAALLINREEGRTGWFGEQAGPSRDYCADTSFIRGTAAEWVGFL